MGDCSHEPWGVSPERTIEIAIDSSQLRKTSWFAMSGALSEIADGANFSLTADLERKGGLMSRDTLVNPWEANTQIQRVEVNAKVGYVLPGQDGRSGSQWTASTYRHWQGFGNRSYDGQQNTFRAKVLRSGFLGSEDRQFSAGVSYLYDDFLEVGTWGAAPTDATANPEVWARTEHVPGAFLETTWTGHPRGMVVAGLRVDQHNLWGTIVTPRLHARWSATEQMLKMVAGTFQPRIDGERGSGRATGRGWYGPLEPERVERRVQIRASLLSATRTSRLMATGPNSKTARSSTLTRTPTRSAFTTSAIGNRVP